MNIVQEIAEKNGMCLRPLIDLPSEQESRFHPSSFISRKFLERFHGLVKEEIRPYILKPTPEVALYESDGTFRRAVTWEMVMERRRQRQKAELTHKRYDYSIKRKPLYVWVFWCPGINDFIYRGYWTYLVGLGGYYHGGGCKGDLDGELLEQVIELFPLVEKDLFGNFDYDLWMRRFIVKYERGMWGGKPQGKAPVWAEVGGSRVEKILSRAE